MEDPINAIIIDDETDAREGLQNLLKTYYPEVNILATAENASQGLNKIIEIKPDLIFLDIKMPGKDGFYVAKEMQALNLSSSIIFVTAYDSYAIRAIRHAAFDFLTKPIDQDDLSEAIARFKVRREKESLKEKLDLLNSFLSPSQIRFYTQKGFVMIDPHDIIYCLAEGNYTELYLVHGRKIMVTQQIGQIEDQISNKNFVRISRSYLLNIRYMKELNRKKKCIELTDENLLSLPVSRSGIKRLMNI